MSPCLVPRRSRTGAATLAMFAAAVVALSTACDEGPWDPDVAGEPFPRLTAAAYACGVDVVGVCWGLEQRDSVVARYHGVTVEPRGGADCRRIGAPDDAVDEIICGRVLMGVLPGTTRDDYVEAAVRARGRITKFTPGSYAVLEVAPGREIDALHKVIYGPDIRYADLESGAGTLDVR